MEVNFYANREQYNTVMKFKASFMQTSPYLNHLGNNTEKVSGKTVL